MDSISQMALGASLAYLSLGKHLGRRSVLIGAALGTLPDLDVLVPYADAIDSFTYHRSWSHSLLALSAASMPIAWILNRMFRNQTPGLWRCWLCVWLVLITHPLLDAMTLYGTQIWWPLGLKPSAWGSIFIIDPAYTLPLVFGLIIAWRNHRTGAQRMVCAMLGISTLYLGWTLFAQHQVRQTLETTINAEGIVAETTVVAPFPLSLMWRTLVVSGDRYYEGYRSLFDQGELIRLHEYDNGKLTYQQWLDHPPVQRLDWFTNGAFALAERGDQLVASDLRMGVEQSYVFEFLVAVDGEAVLSELLPVDIDTDCLSLGLRRVLDESIDLSPR